MFQTLKKENILLPEMCWFNSKVLENENWPVNMVFFIVKCS